MSPQLYLNYTYTDVKAMIKKIFKKIFIVTSCMLGILLVALIVFCGFSGSHYTNYKLTSIDMQRVEVDDSTLSGKVLYQLTPTFKGHDWVLSFNPFNHVCGPGYGHGSYEPIHDIIVSDANGRRLNDGIQVLTYTNNAYPLGTIIYRFMEHKGIFNSYLLCMEAGESLPESIAVELPLSKRTVKAKVNNTPQKITRQHSGYAERVSPENKTKEWLRDFYETYYVMMTTKASDTIIYELVRNYCTPEFAAAIKNGMRNGDDLITHGYWDKLFISEFDHFSKETDYYVFKFYVHTDDSRIDAETIRMGLHHSKGGDYYNNFTYSGPHAKEPDCVKLAIYLEDGLISNVEEVAP